MIETAIKEDLYLNKELIIPENRLEALRILAELHPVVGGQPTHEKDQPNDNNPFLDLACTIAHIHESGIGQYADLRPIQDEAPQFFFGKGFMSGISNLQGNGILAIFGHWRDASGHYAIKQFYYTDREISYRNAESDTTWGRWITILTDESSLDYNRLLNVPITSTLSDDKDKIASIYSVNQVNKTAVNAQKTANIADGKAVDAQKSANTAITNAKTADDKAVKAQSTANTANTNAKNADDKAVKAQSTANTANTNAKNADDKAVKAQNTANTAITNAKTADDKAVKAQNTANTAITNAKAADDNAVKAQNTANTAITNAKTADDKAVKAQARADAAFSRIKPITEGGTGANNATNARKNLGLGNAAERTVATSSTSNTNTLVTLGMLNTHGIGYGQKWMDVRYQRVLNTTYINATGKPIQMFLNGDLNTGAITIDEQTIHIQDYIGGGSFLNLIIPNDSSYKVMGQNVITSWWELR